MDGQNNYMYSVVTVEKQKMANEYLCSHCSQYHFITINVYASLNKTVFMCKIIRPVYFKSGSWLAWSKKDKYCTLLTQYLSITKALLPSNIRIQKANALDRDIVVVIVTCYGLMRPGVSEIFRPFPDRHWSPASLLYKAYRISLPGGTGSVVWRWPLSSIYCWCNSSAIPLLPPLVLHSLF